MNISKKEDESVALSEERYPLLLRSVRVLQWAFTRGSLIQVMGAIGAVAILGQLLFGAITVTAAMKEFAVVAILWLAGPRVFPKTFGKAGFTAESDLDD